MRLRRLTCRSLWDCFLVLILVASLSVLFSFQVTKFLAVNSERGELQIHVNGRVDIYRNLLEKSEKDLNEESWNGKIKQLMFRGRHIYKTQDLQNRTLPKHLTPLYRKLKQLQDDYLISLKEVEQLVSVQGSKMAIDRDLPLYQQALRKQGFSMQVPAWYKPANSGARDAGERDEPPENENGPTIDSHGSNNWLLLLCMAFNDGDDGTCLQREHFDQLQQHQKVNRIPGIRNTLWRKDNLCNTMNAVKHIPSIQSSHFALPCYILPTQFEQLRKHTEKYPDVRWILKSALPGGDVELVEKENLQGLSTRIGVIQQYFDNPLLLFGLPFNVRVFVLVTSISPLRAYIHSEGLVNYRHEANNNFRKVPNRTWFLTQLRHYLTHNFGKEAATVTFNNMESVVLQTLLIAETTLAAHFSGFSKNPLKRPYRCQNCFQLLGFDLIFNSSFHPVVIEVNGQPHMQEATTDTNNWATNIVKRGAIDDMMSMLFSRINAVDELTKALKDMDQIVGLVGINCKPTHKACLTELDLQYLLEGKREYSNRGDFQQLYPSASASKYNTLLRDLHQHMFGSKLRPFYALSEDSNSNFQYRHTTAELNDVLANLVQYFDNYHKAVDSYDDMNVPLKDEFKSKDDDLVENIFPSVTLSNGLLSMGKCSEAEETMPYITGIYTEPKLDIKPKFDPTVTEYYVSVSYDLVLVRIWAMAQSCVCEARLEERFGIARPSNYSLGIGENKITFLVVDITHSDPWVINTYTLHVYRESRSEHEPSFDIDAPHKVCSLTQECGFQLDLSLPCGIHPSTFNDWSMMLKETSKLPYCDNGGPNGQWLVPCENCDDKSLCYWQSAIWQPHNCIHLSMPREQVQQCMLGKKVLFIGDSTNRGMMHYLMEQVNHTLLEWDKTHNIKVYRNLNGNGTTVSFIYYPQFWLPGHHRPVFEKALYQLLKSSQPLTNDSNTVLVVGGVQWVATHHLSVLAAILAREGLTGIHVIIKGFGSGFHLPVEGLHCMGLPEQRKLLKQNQAVMDHASNLGFSVVDTFKMTTARYKDFLQGKCACHYHKVSDVKFSSKRRKRNIEKQKVPNSGSKSTQFHVEGNINSIYSEILLNRICGKPKR